MRDRIQRAIIMTHHSQVMTENNLDLLGGWRSQGPFPAREVGGGGPAGGRDPRDGDGTTEETGPRRDTPKTDPARSHHPAPVRTWGWGGVGARVGFPAPRRPRPLRAPAEGRQRVGAGPYAFSPILGVISPSLSPFANQTPRGACVPCFQEAPPPRAAAFPAA